MKTVAMLRETAFDAIGGLVKLARAGDDVAARELWNIAFNTVENLSGLVKEDTGPTRGLLKKCDRWPVILPVRRADQKALESALAKLGFGQGCELNVLGKYQPDAPLTKVVLKIFGLLNQTARKSGKPGLLILFNGCVSDQQNKLWREWVGNRVGDLPTRLTKQNARQWADLTEPVLEIFWGEDYERHSDFTNCGKRAEILTRWRQAWNSIANSKERQADQ